jgi:hypothetical protein
MGRLSEYISKKFGQITKTVDNPVTSTVNTTATLIALNNPDRLMLIAVNLSSNDGYFGWE